MSYEWEASAQQEEALAQAVEFAKNYLVFELDERARTLLAQWEDAYARKRTPVDATINQYVANETMREFLQKIREQINFARREGK